MDLEPFYEVNSLMELGEYETALGLLNNLKANDLHVIFSNLISADIHIFRGDFSKAKQILANYRNFKPKIDLLPYIQLYFTILDSSFHLRFNRTVQAYNQLSEFDMSVDKFDSTDSLLKRWNSRFHHTFGNAALALGKFQEAEQSYNTAISLRKREDDLKGLSSSLNKLSIVHRMLGNLDQSEHYILEALDIEEGLGNRQAIGVAYCTLGILMRQKGERNKAQKYFEEAISNLKFQKNPFLVSVTYYELFLTIVNENTSEALMIEDELRNIVKDQPANYRIAIIYQIIHAIRLNLSRRGIEKFEGQQILKNLQNQVIEDVRLKITVTTRLIFSLLEEYKAFGDQNVLEEIKELTEQLYQLSLANNSKFLEGEVMLIKANLELVSGNVKSADKLMNQAEKFAEELNLRHLVKRIQDSKTHFEKELAYWNEVLQNSSSIMERITKSRISSYLERMLELIEVGLISEERG